MLYNYHLKNYDHQEWFNVANDFCKVNKVTARMCAHCGKIMGLVDGFDPEGGVTHTYCYVFVKIKMSFTDE